LTLASRDTKRSRRVEPGTNIHISIYIHIYIYIYVHIVTEGGRTSVYL